MSANTPVFKRVMVIDDNPIDLYITDRVIRKCDFSSQVLQFSSAQEALQYLTEHKNTPELLPEIIFVDIYMPQMSGFEFMEEYDLFSDSLKSHCSCYIISSSLDHKDILRAGADINVVAFQEKPVNNAFLEQIASARQ